MTTPDELRSLFLFESLTDEQLGWLAERGSRRTYVAGGTLHREGDAGAELFLLLEGGVRLSRTVSGESLTISETTQRGAYTGAVRAYLDDEAPYLNSATATVASSFFVLPAADFKTFMKTWFPLAVHLLDGLFLGVRNSEATVRQREHLARLGTLSANLAHELNNPAAAAARATEQLRGRVAGMRNKLAMLGGGKIDGELLRRLVSVQESSVELAAKRRHDPLTPMEESDREDAIVDRLEELGIGGAYDLAAVYVGAGLDVEWLDRVVAEVGRDGQERAPLEPALRWLSYTLETESLMDEVEDATSRISGLVAAVKQYSYMDGASVQEVDVHAGLDSTVVMLGHKLQGVHVVRDYDRALPRVPVRAAELNQVWTNLIDNAADAVGSGGTVTLRTRAEGDCLVVEVADDGPGIPPEVQPRIFEAFYTTKGPGLGTGLGLENAIRIVEKRHSGSLTFDTGPDGTTFRVCLPLQQRLT